MVRRTDFAENANETVDNNVIDNATIAAFFDSFDYSATPVNETTQPNLSMADFTASVDSNASFTEGFIEVTGPAFIRFQTTNNVGGRIDLGVDLGAYQPIVTYYNGPGQPSTSPSVMLPLGLHRIRATIWDYDGLNGNMNVQCSLTQTGGFSTNLIDTIRLTSLEPVERCFVGCVTEGSEDVTELATGLVVAGARLAKVEIQSSEAVSNTHVIEGCILSCLLYTSPSPRD